MRATIWPAILTCVFAAPAYSQQGAPSAVPVGIVIAERKPISKTLDKVGRTALTKGNVVGPESGVLTMIVSQDPMYVVAREELLTH